MGRLWRIIRIKGKRKSRSEKKQSAGKRGKYIGGLTMKRIGMKSVRKDLVYTGKML